MHTRINIPNRAAGKARPATGRKGALSSQRGGPTAALIEEFTRTIAEKDRLLGFAAHELRNPLSTICGLAEFLHEGAVGELTPHQRNLVKTIHTATQAALELVNQLLEVEGGGLQLQIERHDLVALVRESISLMTLDAVRKDIHLVFEPAEAFTIEADGPKIRQVITNLLSNAIKYSPPGSTVTVCVERAAGHCRMSVRDQGPGIPEHERHRLFTLFGRLSVEPTGGEKATGLGLALCRRIVEAHQGTIGAQNLPGRGCEFCVELKLQLGATVESFTRGIPAPAAAPEEPEVLAA